jgi:hypothetical protein
MPEPGNRQRFEGLDARISRVERSLNIRPEDSDQKTNISWRLIGSTLTIIVTIILAAITATHYIDQQTGALGVRITKAEAAITVLGSQQSDQTQKLIHDLLALAKSADRPEIGARAAQVAASLTATLREQKRSAIPEFFTETNQAINALRLKGDPSLRAAAFTTQQQLAEYRSTLQTEKQKGIVIKCTPGFRGNTAFGTAEKPANPSRRIESLTIENCPQALDGFSWRNIVFVNSQISYKGGPVILDNVTFVNCTFETGRNDEGIKLLQYAALDENTLEIKPEFFPS